MIYTRNFVRRGRRFILLLAVGASAIHAIGQGLAGTYVLQGDSDGTKPKAGAKLELTFSGATSGSVKLFAVRPGETVHDTGTYSLTAHQITIHFKEVDWAAEQKSYSFDGCTLTLPFMAVSSSSSPGTSAWAREDPKCTGQPPSSSQAQSASPKFNPFSADEVITDGGQRRMMKVYATESALRSESSENGQTVVTIMRFDRNLVWTLNPQNKSFVEASSNFGSGNSPLQQAAIAPGCNAAGDEQVGGYLSSKVVCRTTLGKKTYTQTQWSAQALGGLVIKYNDGAETLELQNIKLGPQDAKMFEVPAGYHKESGH